MNLLPTSALLESGFLQRRCAELLILKCSECGLDFGPGDTCQSCFCTASPLRTCHRCHQTLDGVQADGERACHSVRAYEAGNQLPAFSGSEALWACKSSEAGPIAVRAESELRRLLASGELGGAVLVSGPGDTAFSAVSGHGAFPEVQETERRARARAEAREQEAAEWARSERQRVEMERLLRETQERCERERQELERANSAQAEWERLEAERIERDRRENERFCRERADAEVAEAERNKARLTRAFAVSGLSAAAGGWVVWSLPFINPPKTPGYLIGFVVLALLVWALAVSPLYGNDRAPAMRAAAPLVWGFSAFAWPSLVGLVVCLLVANAEFTLKYVFAASVGGLMLAAIGFSSCFYVGAALSIRPPWSGNVPADFRGLRSPWVWIGLALTMVVNVGLVRGKVNGFHGWFDSTDSQTLSQGSRPVSTPAAPVRAEPASPQVGQALLPLPVPTGYLTDVAGAIGADDGRYLAARLELLGKAGVSARALVVATTAPEEINAFVRRVGNAWNAAGAEAHTDILVTVATNDRKVRIDVSKTLNETLTDSEAQRLIDTHFSPAATKSGVADGLRVLVDQLERTLATARQARADEAGLRTTTLQALQSIVDGIGRWDGRQPTLSAMDEAAVDSATASLEAMPRPARGDRKAARQLHANGLSLIGQSGFEALAAEKMLLAHQADPLDVQIVNDLVFAEMSAGRHADAMNHLLATLRLAPTRTSAWVNLAETAPFIGTLGADAIPTATNLYLVGYWFSKDRAKTVEYLRGKSEAPDASGETRAAAANALRRLDPALLNVTPGNATTAPPTATGKPEGRLIEGTGSAMASGKLLAAESAATQALPTAGTRDKTARTADGTDGSFSRFILSPEERSGRDDATTQAAEAAKRVFNLVVDSLTSNGANIPSAAQLLRDPGIVAAINFRDQVIAKVPANRPASSASLKKAQDLSTQPGTAQQVVDLLGEAFAYDPFNGPMIDAVTAALWRTGRRQDAVNVAAWRYMVDPLRPSALMQWMEAESISGRMAPDKAGAMMAVAFPSQERIRWYCLS